MTMSTITTVSKPRGKGPRTKKAARKIEARRVWQEGLERSERGGKQS